MKDVSKIDTLIDDSEQNVMEIGSGIVSYI